MSEDIERRLAWYSDMTRIRLVEERIEELYAAGEIYGPIHLCQGQEAVAVGLAAGMRPADYLTVTYRGHGHAIARGMTSEAVIAELMGRNTGCCKGVGGSMHLTDVTLGLLGAFAIVGANLPVALGAAMSARSRGTDQIAAAVCGDGATNIGTFHETLNMAAVWKAPVVFVVENNLYGEYTPLADATAVSNIVDRAAGYGMASEQFDGQDVLAVREAVLRAAERARGGGGPTLLEARTYRFRGHSRTDPATYRPAGELDSWLKRDPLLVLAAKLTAAGVAPEELDAVRARAEADVDAAALAAHEARYPTIAEIQTYV